MEDLIHDYEEVIWGPLSIVAHNVLHNLIEFGYDIVLE